MALGACSLGSGTRSRLFSHILGTSCEMSSRSGPACPPVRESRAPMSAAATEGQRPEKQQPLGEEALVSQVTADPARKGPGSCPLGSKSFGRHQYPPPLLFSVSYCAKSFPACCSSGDPSRSTHELSLEERPPSPMRASHRETKPPLQSS